MEDEISVSHLVQGAAYGDKVGQDLVGLVEMVTENVGMDLSKLGSGFPAMELPDD